MLQTQKVGTNIHMYNVYLKSKKLDSYLSDFADVSNFFLCKLKIITLFTKISLFFDKLYDKKSQIIFPLIQN